MTQYASLQDAATKELKDASRVLVFDDQGAILVSTFAADPSELKPLEASVGDRDEAIKAGIHLQGTRYEVHRHHPPLVYGRTMGGVPEESEGVAVCKVESSVTGHPAYGVITYAMPNISARMVPLLQKYCDTYVAAKAVA